METKKHRHFVAVPVMILGLGVIGALHTLGGSTPNIESAMLAERAIEGEVLLQTRDYTSMQVADIHVHLFHGAATVLHSDTETTIVALTAPVLVEGNGMDTVIPSGYQLRMKGEQTELLSAPTSWLSSRIQSIEKGEATTFSEFLETAIVYDDTSYAAFQSLLATLTDQERIQVFGHLALLPTGAAMTATVAEKIDTTLRSSLAVRQTIPLTLVQTARSSGKPLPAELLAFWSEDVIRLAAIDTALATDTIVLAADTSDRFSDAGYPVQANTWKQLVRDSAATLRTIVPEEQKKRIASAESFLARSVLPLTASLAEESQSEFAEPPVDIDPAVVIQETRSMLFQHQALLSGESSVTLDSKNPGSARVTGVFKDESTGLTAYAFSYNPETDMIFSIEKGSSKEQLPNPVQSETFFQ